jgi:hypothetical protein
VTKSGYGFVRGKYQIENVAEMSNATNPDKTVNVNMSGASVTARAIVNQ